MSDALDNRVLGVVYDLITSGHEPAAQLLQQLWRENRQLREAVEQATERAPTLMEGIARGIVGGEDS